MGVVKISPEEVKGIKYLGIVSGKVHYLSSAANIHRIVLLIFAFVFKVDMQFLLFFLTVFFLCSSGCNCMGVFLLSTISVEIWKCSVFFKCAAVLNLY